MLGLNAAVRRSLFYSATPPQKKNKTGSALCDGSLFSLFSQHKAQKEEKGS